MTRAKQNQRPKAARCASCQSALAEDAGYCHKCGARVGARRRPGLWKVAVPLVLFGAAAAGLLLPTDTFTSTPTKNQIAVLPDFGSPGLALPPVASQPASPQPATGQPPDLSSMSPREAADRLFNRVMTASEAGNTAEAQQFAPMALNAYRMVGTLDADAEFHVGLISLVADDQEGVARQVAALEATAPGHLLGLALAYEAARKAGDDDAASEALSRFATAYDGEIARGAPEYDAHRTTIERVHALATSTPGASPPLPAASATSASATVPDPLQAGRQLFDANCSGCHGDGALGSDNGPPLVHKYYEPGHHADAAFYLAVNQGVRSHHWNFGNMPPVPGVSEEQVGEIIAYVRDLQRQAGIE